MRREKCHEITALLPDNYRSFSCGLLYILFVSQTKKKKKRFDILQQLIWPRRPTSCWKQRISSVDQYDVIALVGRFTLFSRDKKTSRCVDSQNLTPNGNITMSARSRCRVQHGGGCFLARRWCRSFNTTAGWQRGLQGRWRSYESWGSAGWAGGWRVCVCVGGNNWEVMGIWLARMHQ